MRAFACGVLLSASCTDDPGGGGGNPDAGNRVSCVDHEACRPDICAANGECAQTSEVRSVLVTWTIMSMLPNTTNCARGPSFSLVFEGSGDTFAPSPTLCVAGSYGVAQLPKRFISVQLRADGWFQQSKLLDAQGFAAIMVP